MNKRKKYRSDFLFSTPSFLIGFGSVLNIAGNYYSFNYSSTGNGADYKAIKSDWGVIGSDIEKVSNQEEKSLALSSY